MEWFSGLKYKVGLGLVPTNQVTSRLLLGYLLPRHQDLSWILNLMNTTSRFKDKPKSQNQHTVVLNNSETNSSEIRRFCRTVVPLFLPPTVVEKSWMKHPQVCYNDMIISTKCFITLATLGGGVLWTRGWGRGAYVVIRMVPTAVGNLHFFRRLHKHNVS